jgi:hypothetical protein
MMVKHALLYWLGLSVAHATEDIENGFLRLRKRFESPNDYIVESGGKSNAAEPAMGDLWEQAAVAAQDELDVERLLLGSPDFSMPTRPPIGPTPTRPSPTPPRPTRAPARPNPTPTRTPTPPDGPTPSPVDCLLGRTREEYIFDLLVPITSASLLNDPSTPQGMAFDYLANNDRHLDDPCSSNTIQQRYGLTTLYYATQGAGWVTTQGWLGADQECNWFGVECVADPTIVSKLVLCKLYHKSGLLLSNIGD